MIEPIWVPDMCTLPSAERPLRVAEFDVVLRRVQARPTPRLLRLALLDGVDEAALRDLIARETACCSFFDFTITRDADRLVLDVAVPAGHEAVLDAMADRLGNARPGTGIAP